MTNQPPDQVYLSRFWEMYTEHSCEFSREAKDREDIKYVREALATTVEPCAWMRRWKYEGKEPPPKVKNAKGRWEWPKESKFVVVTPIKLFTDDVPLYAIDNAITARAKREANR